MKTIFCFVAISFELGKAGTYTYAAYESPNFEKNPIVFGENKIGEEFIHGINLAEFYALAVASFRASSALKKYLNGLPFRLVVVNRNHNSSVWANAPAKYIERHAHKGDRVANVFKYMLDLSLDPIARTTVLSMSKHPGRLKNKGKVPDLLRDLDPALWKAWNVSNCERVLRDIKVRAEARFQRLNPDFKYLY